MTTIIKIGGKTLVSGLTWFRPDLEVLNFDAAIPKSKSGQVSDKKIEEILVKKKQAVLIAGDPNSYSVRAFVSKSEMAEIRKASNIGRFEKIYSIAELFAESIDRDACGIFIEAVDYPKNHCIVVAVMNGHPLVGSFDRCVPQEEVSTIISSWTDELRYIAQRSPVLYGGWHNAQELSIEKMIASITAIRPLRKPMADKEVLGVAVIALCVCLIGYVGYGQYVRIKAAKEAKIRAAKEDPIRKYTDQLNTEWSNLQWNGFERVHQLEDKLLDTKLTIGGFSLSSEVKCDLQTAACAYRYVRKTGTFESFKEAAGNEFDSMTFSQDGQVVEAISSVKNLPISMAPDRTTLVNEKLLFETFWPEVQKYGSLVTAALTPDFHLFPLPASPVNEALLPDAVRVTPVSLEFPLFDSVAGREMPPRTPFFIHSVNWKQLTFTPKLEGESSIKITGEVYVSKKLN